MHIFAGWSGSTLSADRIWQSCDGGRIRVIIHQVFYVCFAFNILFELQWPKNRRCQQTKLSETVNNDGQKQATTYHFRILKYKHWRLFNVYYTKKYHRQCWERKEITDKDNMS